MPTIKSNTKRTTHSVRFGIYNERTQKWLFGIQESSPGRAYKKLFDRIGKQAYQGSYTVRRIPNNRKYEQRKDASL